MLSIQPVIDLRSDKAFSQGHLRGSTHLSWDTLPFRLNELPCRPAILSLLGEETVCQQAKAFLIEKGYEIGHLYLPNQWSELAGQWETGTASEVLWRANPLLVEFLDLLKSQGLSFPHKGIDLGCGGGRDTVFLAQQGIVMTGVEHQESVMVRARSLAKYSQVKVDWQVKEAQEALISEDTFDLMVGIRFLDRKIFDLIHDQLQPGGWLIYQTFTEGCEQFSGPKNPKFILKKGELAKKFSDFDIFIDRIDILKDGRPVSSFIAQKPSDHAIR